MLPSQLPSVDAFFTIAVCERVDVKWNRIISANDTGDDLARRINTGLISEVRKDVIPNLSVAGVFAILGLKCSSRFLIQRTKTWTR